MYLEGRTRLHLGAATNWLPRWLAVVFPFSIVGSVLGQGYLVPPPGFQGAPDTPQTGVPTWSAGQAAGQAAAQGNGQVTAPANGQINNGQMNGQMNGPANGQINNGPANGPATAPVNGQVEGESFGNAIPASAPMQGLMRWGALHLRARASYQFLYDTGIHVAPGQSADTFTHTFTPGVTIEVGPHVTLNYTPSFRFFSQRDFHSTIDHFASLTAGAGIGDWSFGLSQSFSRTDEPLVETSGQTDEESYSTGLNISYRFNDKISLDTTAGVGLTVIGGNSTNVFVGGNTNAPAALSDSQSYSAGEWLDYQFDEKLGGGVGVTVGYSAQDGGFRSLDEEYLGRVTWHPGRKLTASINGGIEDRQFLNFNAPDTLNPIFSAIIGYQLLEPTRLSLSASRAVSASLFRSEITESTQVGVGIQQRLLGKLQLSLGFSYGTSDYKITAAKLTTARSDQTTSYNIGLTVPFLKHGSFGTFYEYSKDSSTDGGFGFSSSEVGASISWEY